ncbi:MAG: hypothetical protein ACPGYQ_00760, partial [Candidatus Puniceispirillales bacterium]
METEHIAVADLTETDAIRELDRLALAITYHNQKYHRDDAPEISDAAFDALMRRNMDIEAAFPHLIRLDSPSLTVGATPSTQFGKYRHHMPMLSLSNAFDDNDAMDFDQRVKRFLNLPAEQDIAYSVEPKIDGLSISLRYENGQLVAGVTRGDGIEGEDVTANIRTISDIPEHLTHCTLPVAEIRGEIFMTKADFFALNENQANAILDMRLRSLRKLEEMELRKERDDLKAEEADLNDMMADENRQRNVITASIKTMRSAFIKTDQRMTRIEPQPVLDSDPADMLVEKEPVTIVCSENGWIRSMKGRIEADADIRFREGDAPKFHLHADSTDRLIIGLENGRFYTISIDKLPGGRGFGEPLALMVDIPADTPVVSMMVATSGKVLLASSSGHGFITEIDQLVAQTKTGRQVMTVMDKARMIAAHVIAGDQVACVGSNRKLLVINADEIPVMAKGRGVILQRY